MLNRLHLLACLLLTAPAFAAAPGGNYAPGDPGELLKSALSDPSISYQGRMMVTRWNGKRAHAEEVQLYFSPPNKYRREFLAPSGEVERVVVSDGSFEQVLLIKQHRILKGDAIKSSDKLMTEDRELELLRKNYRISTAKPERVAGRPAWVIELSPNDPGKHNQKIWIDQETRVILENKRYRPGGKFAVMSRFAEFEPRKDLPASLFELENSSGAVVVEHGLDSAFMSIEDLNKATGKNLKVPTELPGGFVFESANFFEVKNKDLVRQIGYTDGLAMISLFITARPVRPANNTELTPVAGTGNLKLSTSGKILKWRSGKEHYTLIGDVSRELLDQISISLGQSANFLPAHP